MSKYKLYGMSGADLERVLVGKSLFAIDAEAGTITLNDGTHLQLEDASDCCSYFEGELHTIDLTENAITAVRVDGEELPDEGAGKWKLTILSVNKEVCAIEIEGDASNGYYCHSIDLAVTIPELTK